MLRMKILLRKKHDNIIAGVAKKVAELVFNPSDSDGTEPKNSLKSLATSIIADGASPPGVARGVFEPRTDAKTHKTTTKQKRYNDKVILNLKISV